MIPAILVLHFSVLCGCATISAKGDENSLRMSAERYWNLRMEDKYNDTYKMEDSHALPPFEQYRDMAMAMKKIRITSISVKSAKVSGDKGVVELEWIYLLPSVPKPFHQIINDEWSFKDGKWVHTFRQS